MEHQHQELIECHQVFIQVQVVEEQQPDKPPHILQVISEEPNRQPQHTPHQVLIKQVEPQEQQVEHQEELINHQVIVELEPQD